MGVRRTPAPRPARLSGTFANLPEDARPVGGGIPEILSRLDTMPPLGAPEPAEHGAARVIAAMLAGLKNWEQGMLDPAAACFKTVVATDLPAEDQWASVYQKLAGDYLEDYRLLTGPLFTQVPSDRAGCQAAIDRLEGLLATLKTRGRARFNVRAWQLDLARRRKLLKAANGTSPQAQNDEPPPDLSDVLRRLSGFAAECRFQEAAAYLESLPEDPQGAKRSSLLAVCESAAEFLSNLGQDLAKQPVAADLRLKSGATITRIAIDPEGRIVATSPDGQTHLRSWSDFSPDSLIALHRMFVKNPASEAERVRRHECAIAYDWLAGNRERALAAAAVLSDGSSAFRKRWQAIAEGLPQQRLEPGSAH